MRSCSFGDSLLFTLILSSPPHPIVLVFEEISSQSRDILILLWGAIRSEAFDCQRFIWIHEKLPGQQ